MQTTRNRKAGGKKDKKQAGANPGIKKKTIKKTLIKKHREHEEHWKHRTDVGKQNKRQINT